MFVIPQIPPSGLNISARRSGDVALRPALPILRPTDEIKKIAENHQRFWIYYKVSCVANKDGRARKRFNMPAKGGTTEYNEVLSNYLTPKTGRAHQKTRATNREIHTICY